MGSHQLQLASRFPRSLSLPGKTRLLPPSSHAVDSIFTVEVYLPCHPLDQLAHLSDELLVVRRDDERSRRVKENEVALVID